MAIVQPGEDQVERPVAFVARHLTRTEQKMGFLSALVSVVAWDVHRVRRYTTFAREVRVVLPTAEDVVVVVGRETNMRLRACVVDLQ